MPFTVQFELFLDYGAVNSARDMNVNGLNFNSLNINCPNINYFSLLSTANCRVCGNLFVSDRCSDTNVLTYKTGRSLNAGRENPATDKLKLAR